MISTNEPAFAPSSRTVPGRMLAYGPTAARGPIRAPRTTEKVTSAPSPTVESTIRVEGPIVAPAPILVDPWRKVIGWITASGAMVTVMSTYVVAGSTSRTPLAMCPARIRSWTTARTAAAPDGEFAPIARPTSTLRADTRSPLSSRIGNTWLR